MGEQPGAFPQASADDAAPVKVVQQDPPIHVSHRRAPRLPFSAGHGVSIKFTGQASPILS